MGYYNTFEMKIKLSSRTPKEVIGRIRGFDKLSRLNQLPVWAAEWLRDNALPPRVFQLFSDYGNYIDCIDDVGVPNLRIVKGSGMVTTIYGLSNSKATGDALMGLLEWLRPWLVNKPNETIGTVIGEDYDTVLSTTGYVNYVVWHRIYLTPEGELRVSRVVNRDGVYDFDYIPGSFYRDIKSIVQETLKETEYNEALCAAFDEPPTAEFISNLVEDTIAIDAFPEIPSEAYNRMYNLYSEESLDKNGMNDRHSDGGFNWKVTNIGNRCYHKVAEKLGLDYDGRETFYEELMHPETELPSAPIYEGALASQYAKWGKIPVVPVTIGSLSRMVKQGMSIPFPACLHVEELPTTYNRPWGDPESIVSLTNISKMPTVTFGDGSQYKGKLKVEPRKVQNASFSGAMMNIAEKMVESHTGEVKQPIDNNGKYYFAQHVYSPSRLVYQLSRGNINPESSNHRRPQEVIHEGKLSAISVKDIVPALFILNEYRNSELYHHLAKEFTGPTKVYFTTDEQLVELSTIIKEDSLGLNWTCNINDQNNVVAFFTNYKGTNKCIM